MTARQAPDAMPAMSERELAKNIMACARECGWFCYHTFLSKWSQPGFPDLFLARNGVALALELKSAKGIVSEAQQSWLDALGQVPGVDARVVRPADLEAVYMALVTGSWSVEETP